MCSACRVHTIGSLYTAIGLIGLIEFIVHFFMPLEEPLVELGVTTAEVRLSFAPLLLPLGIGLLKRVAICRTLALILSWCILFVAFAALALFALAGICTLLSVGDVHWSIKHPVTGDYVARSIAAALLGIPLFVWQFRVIASKDSRDLFRQARGRDAATIEHSGL